MAETAQKPKRELPKSRQMVNEMTAKVYADAWEAKRRGEPVAWSTAIFPLEVPETFGINVLYPENNAAAVSAKHQGDELIAHAEGKMRFPINICSYARLNMGMADRLRDPSLPMVDPAMPLPDMLFLANNSCTQLMKWYENLARALDIPIFFVDCLYRYDENEPGPHDIAYVRGQIENLIPAMEAFLGRKFDWDRFLEVQKRAQRNTQLFDECVALSATKPSPMDGFDLFSYMAPQVICRGKEITTEIFTQWKAEILERIAQGTSTFRGEEKYRVHWEGIACWPNLSYNLKTLSSYGINAVINGYVTAWSLHYEPGDLDGMARAYQLASTNSLSTTSIMNKRSKTIEDFGCDGMLCHVNRSCKLMTFHIFVGREMIEQKNGVPVTNFDGDQSDSRVFSEAQFETRLQGLAEIMAERKSGEVG